MTRRAPPAAVLAIAGVAALLGLIPTWQGYLSEPGSDSRFLGFRYMAGDHYQYAGFIRQARETGSPFMTDPFSTEPQKGVFVLLYFWVLGLTCRVTGMSVTAVWELYRVVGCFLYIVAFWWFAGRFFTKERARLLAGLLFAFGGGLGWLVTLLRLVIGPTLDPLMYPYDYYWNWCTFGTMIVPNWIWPALCLLLAAHAASGASRLRALWIFVLLPAVWFLHAYSGMVAYAAFGLLPLLPLARGLAGGAGGWRRAVPHLKVALPGLASFGLVGAYLMWSRTDGVFEAVSRHGFAWTDTFKLWWYPIGYGLLLPLAWRGRRGLGAAGPVAGDLVLSWLLAALVLSLQPFYAGVKFQYLVFPPLAILAARGLWEVPAPAAHRRPARRLAASLVALCLFLDAPVSLVKDLPAAPRDPWIFIHTADLEAMAFLDKAAPGIVLSSYKTGNRIPWLAGKPVFVGHWFMTIDSSRKSAMVAQFFSPRTPPEVKSRILQASGARYVYRGVEEASMGWEVDAALRLLRIYEKGPVEIYEVVRR